MGKIALHVRRLQVCEILALLMDLEFTTEFMMALVTHSHWVTEASVQEREPLAGAQPTVHTPTLSAVVLCVGVGV